MNRAFSAEHLLRELSPQVLGALVRRFRDFAAAEDAVQEALLVAATKWPDEGVPDDPRAWLIQVAAHRMTDALRSELSRRRRETNAGPELSRVDLSSEAIRLARAVHHLLPDDAECAGLLALMLLTDARRAARSGPGGKIVPLDEQDRTLWDRDAIAEGVALISRTLSRGQVGAYQLQAAITPPAKTD